MEQFLVFFLTWKSLIVSNYFIFYTYLALKAAIVI